MNTFISHPDWKHHLGNKNQLETMVHVRYPITLYRRSEAPTRWTARFRVGSHKFKQSTRKTTFQDAAEVAVTWFFEKKARFDQGLPIAPYSVDQAVKAYCKFIDDQIALRSRVSDNQGVTLKDGTQKKQSVTRYFLGYFKGKAIAEIAHSDMEAFWDWRYAYWSSGPGRSVLDDEKLRRAQGIVSDPGEPKRHTLITEGQIISAVVELAIKQDRIGKHERIDTTPPRRMGKGSVSHPYFERDELNDLLVFVYRKAKEATGGRQDRFFAWHRWAGLIALATYSGIDPSEVLNLTTNELVRIEEKDAEGNPWIAYQCFVSGKRTRRHGRDAKRTVSVLQDATPFIEEWLAVRQTFEFSGPDEGYVFPSPSGGRFNNASALFKRVLQTWGRTKDPRTNREWVLYSFRHTFCTLMIKHKDVSYDKLAKLMGHKDTSMIHRHYSHVTPQDFIQELSSEALMQISSEGLMMHAKAAAIFSNKAKGMDQERPTRKAMQRAAWEFERKAQGLPTDL